MKLFVFNQESDNLYNVLYRDRLIGTFVRDESGFFSFYFESNHQTGGWSYHYLREIADKLEELNKDWEEQIRLLIEDMITGERKSDEPII